MGFRDFDKFASSAEVEAGTVANKAVSPATLKEGFGSKASDAEVISGAADVIPDAKQIGDNYAKTSDLTADNINFLKLGAPSLESVQDWFNVTQSSGLISGGAITDNEDGSVTVQSGEGFIKTADSPTAETKFFKWDTGINVTLTDNGSINWICVCYNSGAPIIQATTAFDSINYTTQFFIGIVYREGTTINIQEVGSRRYDLAHRQALREYDLRGFERSDGLKLGATGTPALKVSLTAGHYYALYEKQAIDAINTNVAGLVRYWHRDGSEGWNQSTETTYENIHYDDGDGTLGELGAGKYGNIWCFVSFDGNLNFVYGRLNSSTLSINQNEKLYTDLPDFISKFCILIGKVIVREGQTTTEEIISAFKTTLETAQAVDHNNLANLNVGDYKHLSADEKTKFDGIEALADVTDATNVEAAGAAMITIPGVNDDITAMTGLDDDGIPVIKVAGAAREGLFGTGTFTSTTGDTIDITALAVGTTSYHVDITPDTSSGYIGEISVESKAENSFVVKNSGSDITTTFTWSLTL